MKQSQNKSSLAMLAIDDWGIEPDMSYLIQFFENLMMNTTHEMKNRFMLIDAPSELTEDRTSTEQVER